MNSAASDHTKQLLPAFYTSAGQELAQRIQARELVLVTYMTFSVALLGASLVYSSYRELALIIPTLAVACALLIVHHDAIIGMLSDYMAELTKDVDAIRWHDSQGDYRRRSLQARHIRDIAAIFYLILTVSASLAVSFTEVKPYDAISLSSVAWWIGLLCLLSILVIFSLLHRFRHKIRPFAQ